MPGRRRRGGGGAAQPLRGHQSKYDVESFDARGSSPSMMFLMFFVLCELVSVDVVAIVGYGVGLATASVRASQTAICPRPRLAHVA